MNNNKNSEDYFEVLRKVQSKPNSSQREMAKELGFSLGKLNYCLKELKKKGLVKIENFSRQKNKISYLRYVITPAALDERVKLTKYSRYIPFIAGKLKQALRTREII